MYPNVNTSGSIKLPNIHQSIIEDKDMRSDLLPNTENQDLKAECFMRLQLQNEKFIKEIAELRNQLRTQTILTRANRQFDFSQCQNRTHDSDPNRSEITHLRQENKELKRLAHARQLLANDLQSKVVQLEKKDRLNQAIIERLLMQTQTQNMENSVLNSYESDAKTNSISHSTSHSASPEPINPFDSGDFNSFPDFDEMFDSCNMTDNKQSLNNNQCSIARPTPESLTRQSLDAEYFSDIQQFSTTEIPIRRRYTIGGKLTSLLSPIQKTNVNSRRFSVGVGNGTNRRRQSMSFLDREKYRRRQQQRISTQPIRVSSVDFKTFL